MFYISFHGGSQGLNSNPGINNIYVYHDSGKSHASPELLPTGGSNPALEELRGFGFNGGNYDNLYVLNGYKKYSQVLLYQLSEAGCVFNKIFASGSDINSILHPYDLSFDTDNNMYVSSQDTNVVTRLDTNGNPSLLPSSLAPYGSDFLSGTFVASSVGALPGIQNPPPDVAAPLGLTVSYSSESDENNKTSSPDETHKVQNSVRGVLFYKGYLFVCDEPANTVKIYDGTTGQLYSQVEGGILQGPVQLLLSPHDNHLYITSSKNGSVVRVDISNGIPAGTIKPETFIDNKVEHISGITFDADGNFYAAKRKKGKVLKFPKDGSGDGEDFIKGLTDEPEFIMYVPKGE
jgi:hypothetical protein